MSAHCPLCPKLQAKSCVFVPADGDPTTARALIVGEAPGAREAKQGKPFVGDSGMELAAALQRAGASRDECYITNVVKCRPQKNRTPELDEIEACATLHLWDEIEACGAQYVFALGATAVRTLAPELARHSLEAIHGIPFRWRGRILLPMFHPTAGMREQRYFGYWLEDAKVMSSLLRYGERDVTVRELPQPPRMRSTGRDQLDYAFWAANSGFSFIERDVVALDTELYADGSPMWVQISTRCGSSRVLWANSPQADEDMAWLKEYLERPTTQTVMHNAVFDGVVLGKLGIFPANIHDTMSMAYLLSEPQSLKALSMRLLGLPMREYSEVVDPYTSAKVAAYLDHVCSAYFRAADVPPAMQKECMKAVCRLLSDYVTKPETDLWQRWKNTRDDVRDAVTSVFGPALQADLSDVPEDEALFYAAQDPDVTLQVYEILRERVVESGQWSAYMRDMRVMPMIIDMKLSGIQTDREKFAELSAAYSAEAADVLRTLIDEHGAPEGFNPGSPPEVANYLFKTLKLPKVKQTASGADSTDVEVIARLAPLHPAANLLKHYRHLCKLQGTYSDKIPTLADANGALHADFSITRTTTGRLACKNPNLMAIPKRSKQGKRIREGFVPHPGCWFVSMDYSQVEMRIASHRAGDEVLIELFRNDEDTHSIAATKMFEIPLEQVDKTEHRQPAKTVQFGILNVISAEGVQRELVKVGLSEDKWPVSRCQEMIDAWFRVYPKVDAYLKESVRRARQFGYVADMWGRNRPVPWIHSVLKRLVQEAERQASNADIQSGAQGIMKEGMANMVPVYRKYQRAGYVCEPKIQIHDDLVMEVQGEVLLSFLDEMKSTLETADAAAGEALLTGLVVDAEVSPISWATLAPVEEWLDVLPPQEVI